MQIQTIMMSCAPQVQNKLPKERVRRFIYKLVTSPEFDFSMMGAILASVFVMMLRHANETPEWQRFDAVANLIFSSIFGLEAILKIIAFNPIKYFKDSWNEFDFLVVCVSFVSVAFDFSPSQSKSASSGLSLIRVLRVARLFRLIPKAPRLLRLFQTLFISLPALGNVGSVMFLFFYIFAVVGMTLFGSMRRNYYLKRHANWEDFPNSILMLFRMSGGENWCADQGWAVPFDRHSGCPPSFSLALPNRTLPTSPNAYRNGVMRESMNLMSCILITDATLPIYGNWYNYSDPIWSEMTTDQWDDHW